LILAAHACSTPAGSEDDDDKEKVAGKGIEGIRGGYASAKQNFPRKTGTAAARDHGITTRRADTADPSRCRRTRRG
jgi:hypothetical protein